MYTNLVAKRITILLAYSSGRYEMGNRFREVSHLAQIIRTDYQLPSGSSAEPWSSHTHGYLPFPTAK
jgi:hypothetical protein